MAVSLFPGSFTVFRGVSGKFLGSSMVSRESAREIVRRLRPARPVQIEGNLAFVTLTKGQVATIDAADVHLVEGRNWYALAVAGGGFYAAREHDGKMLAMHRHITAAPKGKDVDHANRDTLDNRRANLRVCTRSQNRANSAARPSKTGVKGVWERGGRYMASVQKAGRTRHLGPFDTVEAASAAYLAAATDLFGEFARAKA